MSIWHHYEPRPRFHPYRRLVIKPLGSQNEEEKLQAAQYAQKVLEKADSVSSLGEKYFTPESPSSDPPEPKTMRRLPHLERAEMRPDLLEKARQDHDAWWEQVVKKEKEEEHNPFLRLARWLGLR